MKSKSARSAFVIAFMLASADLAAARYHQHYHEPDSA